MYYKKSDHQFVKFIKSPKKGKKYRAIIKNKLNGKLKNIDFGSSLYQHYRDSTGLNLWSHKDHGDPKRRANYRKRHKVYLKTGYYSPSHYSWHFLW